ncbi:MAG TPA: FAD-dependent oxidoreductase, partial [Nocardioidaceae bacterium]|nr:FAD-dependent oxidoreductase [Nocardioidaceae bacterium]
FPGLDPERSTAISCVYDNTENGDFVIDRLGPIVVATGFNGEGFKFVPLIGEMLRDLVLDVAEPPAMFALARHQR